MNSSSKLTSRLAALFLMCAVMQVYVFANANAPNVVTKDAPANAERVNTTPNALLFGRLETQQESPVALNGNMVNNGTTVLSGSQIQTSEALSAAVELNSLGRLDIAPGTDLTLNFDKNSVSVVVTKGDAFLATKDGVKGSVITPKGETKSGNAALASLKGAPGSAEPALASTPGHHGAFFFGAITFVAIIVVTIIIVIVHHDNPTRSGTN